MGFGTPRDEPPLVVDDIAKVYTTESYSGFPDVRKFDVKAVNDMIERQVSAMKEDENIVCTVFADRNGGHAAIVGKLPKLPGRAHWTVYSDVEWDGDWNVGTAFRWAV